MESPSCPARSGVNSSTETASHGCSTVLPASIWGKKRLAYVIKKQREGNYVLMVVEGGPALVKELERRLRVTDGVLRFITVRVDEDLAKAERRKAQRAVEDAKRRERTGGRPPKALETEEVEL